jgi:hypothetical protein
MSKNKFSVLAILSIVLIFAASSLVSVPVVVPQLIKNVGSCEHVITASQEMYKQGWQVKSVTSYLYASSSYFECIIIFEKVR